jgi:hypothetical protein
MVEVSIERELEFSAKEVWAVIADFGNVDWVPGVEKVELEGEGVGMVRHLSVPVYPPLHERLDAIDHQRMLLDYSIPAVAYLQVKNYRARAQVFELEGPRCRVRWSGWSEADDVDEATATSKTEAFYEAILTWISDFLKGKSQPEDLGASSRRFEIEGKSLGYPALFQDASSAVGLFMVPASGAQALIRDTGFEVAQLLPGRAAFSLSCVHYRESDCGAYNEISMAFFVKKKHGKTSGIPYLGTWLDIARDDAATCIWKLPVTTRLANDAGIRMWGFQKTIEEIDFEVSGGRAAFDLRMGGQEVLSYSVRARGKQQQPRAASAVYSNFEGAPHVTYLEHEVRDVGVSLGGGRLRLGSHPIAEQLRGLGLPRRPFIATWMGHLSFEVGPPEKL